MPTATPALATLALQLLNRRLRLDGAVHDVADDARAALDVALHELQKGPSKELDPPPMQARVPVIYMSSSHRWLLTLPLATWCATPSRHG